MSQFPCGLVPGPSEDPTLSLAARADSQGDYHDVTALQKLIGWLCCIGLGDGNFSSFLGLDLLAQLGGRSQFIELPNYST